LLHLVGYLHRYRFVTFVRPSPPSYICSHGSTWFQLDKYFVKAQFLLKPLAKY